MIHELRIYTASPGRMGDLLARFRDHTMAIFERHGIRNIVYWTNSIGGRSDELWYVVGFDSMAQRDEAWNSFRNDPEWQQVRRDTEADGPIVDRIENRILEPTQWSPQP